MALAAAGGQVLGAFGTSVAGESEKKSQDYNAGVALQNADLTRQQTVEDARRQRVMARKVIGDARANYGASGIGLQGSALDILGESAANAELDALTIEHNGENRARMYESEAQQDTAAGRAARTAGYLGAAGKGAAAAGEAYSSYKKSPGSNLAASKVKAGR